MAKVEYVLTAQDTLHILAESIQEMRNAGVKVGIKHLIPQNGKPDRVVIVLDNVKLDNGFRVSDAIQQAVAG